MVYLSFCTSLEGRREGPLLRNPAGLWGLHSDGSGIKEVHHNDCIGIRGSLPEPFDRTSERPQPRGKT